MTAEIALLNPQGVALAADSAVTVRYGESHKIYNSANKLFTLSKYAPVGVMIYGDAEFRGVPWDILIKKYRHELGVRKFQHLKAYADDFCRFLKCSGKLFPTKTPIFYERLGYAYSDVRDRIVKEVKKYTDKHASIDQKHAEKISADVIKKFLWELQEKLDVPKEKPKRYHDDFIKAKKHIQLRIAKVFEKNPLSGDAKICLIEIAEILLFYKPSSGVLVAGYGEKEIFPSAIKITADNFLRSTIKIVDKSVITNNEQSVIIPLAQREMVDTFLRGISPGIQKSLDEYMQGLFADLPQHVVGKLPIALPVVKKAIFVANVKKGLEDMFVAFKERFSKVIKKQSSPIVSVVTSLPKDELAAMAEALINLTSFKRHISREAETVGGPIDVAVISKWDGFIWIKRKHYFKAELNQHFITNYFRSGS